jgi:threonine aldolase
MIDLRSDTVTKPSEAMRIAMAAAEVGDDVYGEDPTVNRLQDKAAEIFGREAALFVPTGSMGNQIAVKLHTRPGDEIVIEERGHIYNYEMGQPAVLSGVMVRPVRSGGRSGMLDWDEIDAALHLGGPYYSSRTGLICLENTHNLAGGTIMSAKHCASICEKAHAIGLPIHMDGARIFNAAVALGTPVAELTADCDSVQFCLSKGLGAPAGSVLLGAKAFIDEARIWRKRLGGGMRQVGVLAAAGLIALDDGPKRLYEDHDNARRLAAGLNEIPGISIDPDSVMTNIVIFDVSGTGRSPSEICDLLKGRGILAIGFDNSIRMVTHCDISAKDVSRTLDVLRAL